MIKNLFCFIIYCLFEFASAGQVADSSDSLLISDIMIEGNFVSSKKVIYREVAFKAGSKVLRDDISHIKQTSINNLTKTALFNFIEIVTDEIPTGCLDVTIRLTERWFVWPTLYLNHTDRNFSEWWRNKDLNKLEYGVGLKVNNFRGMGESLKLNYRFGNFTKYDFEYTGIRLDKAEQHFLSLKAGYLSQKILPWVIQSNNYLTLKAGNDLMKSTNIAVKYTYRKAYFNSHSLGFGYSEYSITDTIMRLNPLFFGLNNQQQRYFNIGYEFTRDTRDSHFYPKTGHLIVASINKKGLGILKGEFSRTDLLIKLFGYRKLIPRVYVASAFLFDSNTGMEQVFFDQTGLGYLQFVRGYEYYAVDGDQSLLFKSLVKFELLPMKVINLKVWPIRKMYQVNRIPLEIYANLFFDAGYVHDRSDIYKQYGNTLVNKVMYGTGVGIDFVTYYDKTFRLDYSFNGLGESGLFIHWKAAIR